MTAVKNTTSLNVFFTNAIIKIKIWAFYTNILSLNICLTFLRHFSNRAHVHILLISVVKNKETGVLLQ